MLQRSYRPLIPLLLASLLGCAEESAPLDQQLYVWQRQWRPAHAEALAQSRADFSTLRVLALQAQPQAGWSRARIDAELLRRDARPLIAVVRLDGQLPQLDPAEIGQQLAALVRDWQAAGLRLSGLEIDHDCATSRLPAYAELLREVRRQLPAELRLSITALPAWLDSPALDELLTSVDSSVLQVHAVSDPQQGLFDPEQAARSAQAPVALKLRVLPDGRAAGELETADLASLPPADAVRYALATRSRSVAYTYSEPVVFYEYMLDTARLARAANCAPSRSRSPRCWKNCRARCPHTLPASSGSACPWLATAAPGR